MPEREADLIARIVKRLRKDHPDPAMRTELYADGKLEPYVRTLINDPDADDALVARVATAVRGSEDGDSHANE